MSQPSIPPEAIVDRAAALAALVVTTWSDQPDRAWREIAEPLAAAISHLAASYSPSELAATLESRGIDPDWWGVIPLPGVDAEVLTDALLYGAHRVALARAA
ncbi:MAG TPA: hypothetical protein VKB57_02595 [Acidimicrobiales bacterium]|nr:hypothetical protein [Acidimicrobiales bacterium]